MSTNRHFLKVFLSNFWKQSNKQVPSEAASLAEDDRMAVGLSRPFCLSLEDSESSETAEMGRVWVLRAGGLAPCTGNCCLGEQGPSSHGAGASGGAGGNTESP